MRRTTLWLAAAGLLAAGCAEESDPSPETDAANTAARQEQPATPVPASDVTVILSDTTLRLASTRVQAGAVSFHIRNAGTRPHALVLRGAPEEYRSLELPPGDSVTMSVALAAGRYELSCPLTTGAPHAARERAQLQVD